MFLVSAPGAKFPNSPDVNAVYSVNQCMTGAYAGETAAHILVIKRNLKLLQLLVQNGADVTRPRATGSFFSREGRLYVSFVKHILSSSNIPINHYRTISMAKASFLLRHA